MPGVVSFAPAQVGEFKIIDISDPAAGSEISYTVPSVEGVSVLWKVIGFRCLFVTSADFAMRQVSLQAKDAAGLVSYDVISSTIHPQSFSLTYYFNRARKIGSAVGTMTDIILGLWDGWIGSGYQIVTYTANIQPADQFSNISLAVQEFKAQE